MLLLHICSLFPCYATNVTEPENMPLTAAAVKKKDSPEKMQGLLWAINGNAFLQQLHRTFCVRTFCIFFFHAVTTYVNAAPYDASMTDEVYKLADIICVNETETSRITGMKIANKAEYQAAANAILAKGCKAVIITLGDQGACFCTSADRQLTYVPAEKVDVEDPTGAGDAFNGAFAYHHVRHPDMPLADRIKKACDIASITVQSPGTQLSYPDRADIPESLL